MQKNIFKQTALLESIGFVSSFRDLIGTLAVLKVLHETAAREWEGCYDANGGEHLIKGVFQSNTKGDAVKTYVAKVVAQYMKSVGVRLNTWTKNTIAAENQTNLAIINRIAATEFQSNDELFKLIVTRLIGFDDGLVECVLAEETAKKAELIVGYLGAKFELFDEQTDYKETYSDAIYLVETKLKEEGFNNDYFEQTIRAVISYFDSVEEDGSFISDHWDMLNMFERE